MTRRRPFKLWIMLLVAMAAVVALHAQPSNAQAQAEASDAIDAPADTSKVEGADPSAESESAREIESDGKGDGDALAPVVPSAVAGLAGVRSGGRIAIIPIEGMIYDFTFESLERRVDRARANGATIIVLELDTPGGVADSAMKVSKYLKALDLPTIAWVNNEAYSGGIMLAAACDTIVMSPSSATGDCAPIVPGQDLSATERAKFLSPILTEFRDSAQQNDYDYALFHAMCVLGIEVYQIEHKSTGEVIHVNQSDYAVMVEGADPQSVAAPGEWMSRVFGTLTGSGNSTVGAPTVQVATDADRGQWRLVKRIHDGQTLLTLTQTEAMDVGLSSAIIAKQGELEQFLGAASLVEVKVTWSERLAQVLTHPLMRVVLIVALLVGGYFELQAPGLGIGGAVALVAVLGLFGGPYLAGLAETWHILMFLAGVVLIAIEFFVLPGFGIFGASGIVCMFLGLALSVVPSGLSGPERWGMLQQSVLWLLLGGFISSIGFAFLTKYFGSIPLFTKLMLASPDPNQQGPPGSVPHISGDQTVGSGRITIGQTGRVTSRLRPIGCAEFDGELVDVICDGAWLEVGQTVRVTEVHGNRIVVEPA